MRAMGKKTETRRGGRGWKLVKRDISWAFLLPFLLGCVFGGFIAEPISDFIFFMREQTGLPLTPEEQVLYWYYLSTSVDLGIFFVAFISMEMQWVSPSTFRYALIIFALTSIVLSLRVLNMGTFSLGASLLLIAPNIVYVFVLYYAVSFKIGRKRAHV